MKTLSEIEEELSEVDFLLRSSYTYNREEVRQKQWRGYRDALIWVLGQPGLEDKKKETAQAIKS